MLVAAAALVAFCGAVPARAAMLDAGPPLPESREFEVQRGDGGFVAPPEASGNPDAGTALAIAPPELVEPSSAEYPEDLRAQRVAGTVRLELLIDEAGNVEEALVASGADPKLDAAAVAAARKLRFRPAQHDGRPIAVRMHFDYEFDPGPPPPAASETVGPKATLAGLVRARGRRTPLPGAHLETSAGTFTAGPDGRFCVEVGVGEQSLRVSAPGYRAETYKEKLAGGEALEVIYALDPIRISPYETIVRAERERTEVSRVTLRNQELREVPGTMGDPFRVIMLLPGVGSMLSGVAYPVVRGSPPAATGYFIDGIPVPLLFHLFLGPAVIHPDFLEAVDFYPGSPPTQYGRLVGGVIDGRIARPREEMVRGSFYADLINAGGFIEYPFKETGTNVTVAGRVAYTAWLTSIVLDSLDANPNDKVVLRFWDYQARVEQAAGGGKLRLFAFGSSDTFGFQTSGGSSMVADIAPAPGQVRSQDSSDTTSESSIMKQMQNISFHRVDLRYRHPAALGEYELGLTWGTEQISSEGTSFVTAGTDQGTTSVGLTEDTYGARVGWKAPLGEQLRLESGMEVVHRRPHLLSAIKLDETQQLDVGKTSVAATFFGAWLRMIWETADKGWSLAPGLRFDNYHANNGANHVALEPRLSARWQLSEVLALKGGAGLYHQQPVTLINVPLMDTATLQTGLQEAAQFSVGAEWKALDGIEFSAESFFDPLIRTIEFVPNVNLMQIDGTMGANPQDLKGFRSSGYAYGLELMLRHPLGRNWFGWISYTLQRSTRLTSWLTTSDAGQVVKRTAYLPFAFDQTHLFNAVLGYKFASNWSLGVAVHYNSGRPETGVATSVTQRASDTGWTPVTIDNAGRLPGFFRVDVRASKTWVFDLYELELYLDVLNVSMRKEAVAYSYDYGPNSSQVPASQDVPVRNATGIPIVIPTLGLRATY